MTNSRERGNLRINKLETLVCLYILANKPNGVPTGIRFIIKLEINKKFVFSREESIT